MSAVVVESAVGRVEVAGGLLSRAVGWVQSAAAGAGDRAVHLTGVRLIVGPSVPMRSVEGSFPDVGRLLPEFDGVEHGPVQLGFNAAFLQDFAAAARKVDRDATLLLAGSCPDKAFGVQVHAPGSPLYCYGLLMPVRPGR